MFRWLIPILLRQLKSLNLELTKTNKYSFEELEILLSFKMKILKNEIEYLKGNIDENEIDKIKLSLLEVYTNDLKKLIDKTDTLRASLNKKIKIIRDSINYYERILRNTKKNDKK